jgi:hypothetical protein
MENRESSVIAKTDHGVWGDPDSTVRIDLELTSLVIVGVASSGHSPRKHAAKQRDPRRKTPPSARASKPSGNLS